MPKDSVICKKKSYWEILLRLVQVLYKKQTLKLYKRRFSFQVFSAPDKKNMLCVRQFASVRQEHLEYDVNSERTGPVA